jgi:hypothetical protein
MLTRAVFALVLVVGMAASAAAEEITVLALGLADHEVAEEELETGTAPPVPRFNSPGVAYVLAADLKKGDVVEIALVKDGEPLLSNSETLAEERERHLLQAGKSGVPAGGWPEGKYQAVVKITRDGKTLIEKESGPITFE